MVMPPEMLLDMGPPPQELLDQMWLWKSLMVGFSVCFFLQMVALDVAGALLSALLLGFGWVMLKDGMQDMSKYALIYSLLCGLNFFFDLMPLLGELSGRVTRRMEIHGRPVQDVNGTTSVTFTVAEQKTAFFDPSLGLTYNAESLSMILTPICMGMGCFLAARAHSGIQQLVMPEMVDDWGTQQTSNMRAMADSRQGVTIRNAVRAASGDWSAGSRSDAMSGRETLNRFEGRPHKLTDDDDLQPRSAGKRGTSPHV